jgi:hypothetical protein
MKAEKMMRKIKEARKENNCKGIKEEREGRKKERWENEVKKWCRKSVRFVI